MRRTAAMLLLLFTWIGPATLVHVQPDEPGTAAANAVIDLLHAKCNTCHGSHVDPPKGQFGYVLDLPRVAANIDLVEPGDAELSGLFWVVEDGSMPPPASGIEPLTETELAAVRQWTPLGGDPPRLR